eukprot:4148661-Pyramimonas_sp.AAC.2
MEKGGGRSFSGSSSIYVDDLSGSRHCSHRVQNGKLPLCPPRVSALSTLAPCNGGQRKGMRHAGF